MQLRAKGRYESTDQLIDEVFSMEARNTPMDSMERLAKTSSTTINKILNNFEPSLNTQVDILGSKIYSEAQKGHNVAYLLEQKTEIEKRIEAGAIADKPKLKDGAKQTRKRKI